MASNTSKAREMLVKMIVRNPRALETAPAEARENVDFLYEAIEENATVMEYVTDSLRNDTEFVLRAVARNPRAFWHAPLSMQRDEKIIVAAIAKFGADLRETTSDQAPTMSFFLRCLESSRTAVAQYRDEIDDEMDSERQKAKLREDALKAEIAALSANLHSASMIEEPVAKKTKLLSIGNQKKSPLGAWQGIEQSEGLCAQALHLECLRVSALQNKLEELAKIAREAGADPNQIAKITEKPLLIHED